MNNAIKIWKSRGAILEGIKNNIFKKEDVENIAAIRADICNFCTFLDNKGSSCAVPGTAPCCSSCGCSLAFKLRALSTECPEGFWKAETTQEEEDAIMHNLTR
jgi:hypothetical protein